LLFSAMCVIWGIPYLLIKVAVRELSPVTLVFARCTIAVVLLLPVTLARGELRPVLRYWKPLFAFTAAEVAIPWLLLSVAEQRLTSSLTGLLVAAVPLVGVGIAFARGATAGIGLTRIAGLLVGVAGVAALVGVDVRGAQLGAALAVAVVVVGYAVGPVVLSKYLAQLPPLGVITASLSVVAIGYAPFALTDLPHKWPSARVTESAIVLGTVCTALAFLLFFALIAEVGPVEATVITYVNPAVAVLLGAVFLHEHITPWTLLGFALILSGSFLATRATVAPIPSPMNSVIPALTAPDGENGRAG
jgi:drug/metabolite transporter (DMT)-like permease